MVNIKETPEYRWLIDTVFRLYRDRAIDTRVAGTLLLSVNARQHVLGDPEHWIGQGPTFKDSEGQVWTLGRPFHDGAWTWTWSGRFEEQEDRTGKKHMQPLLSCKERNEWNIPFDLLRLVAAHVSQS